MSDAFGRGITVTEMTAVGEPVDVRTHSAAAFVGRALRGPLNTPVRIGSFGEFSRRFGGTWGKSGLGPAVQQFFDNGGRRLYVVRVANGARGAMICLPAHNGVLVLSAVEPGTTETVRVSVDYDRIAAGDDEHFNLTVQRIAPGTSLVIDQEIHDRLSCREDSKRFVADVLNNSDLVRVRLPAPSGRPLATVGPEVGGGDAYILPAQRGTDGEDLSDYDLVGCAREQTGLFALNGIDALDFVYLPARGAHGDPGPTALMAAELYCRKRGAMLVVDPAADWSTVEDAVAGARKLGFSSPNMLSYFPRVLERGRASVSPRAAGGAVAGLLCRLGDRSGPWVDPDQPAFALNPALVPAVTVDASDEDRLVREGLNIIRTADGGRSRLRGSVTTARSAGREDLFTNLGVRRLCLHVTNTLGRATRWAVFQSGGPTLASEVRAQVHAFLAGLADQGAFANDDFYAQCDTSGPVDPRDPGRGITIIVSFVPAGAAEPVSLTLHQTVQGCRSSSTAFAPGRETCL